MNLQFLREDSPTLYEQIKTQIDDLIAHYKAESKDGWTLSEVWSMTTRAIASLDAIFQTASGEFSVNTKRDVLLNVFGELYDQVIAPLDIPYVPDLIEKRFLDPRLRKVFISLVSGGYDALLRVASRAPSTPPVSGGAVSPPTAPPAASPPSLPSDWKPY